MKSKEELAEPLINPALINESSNENEYAPPYSPSKIATEGMSPKIKELLSQILEPEEKLLWWQNKGITNFTANKIAYPVSIGGCVSVFFTFFIGLIWLEAAFNGLVLLGFILVLAIEVGVFIFGVANLTTCYIITNRRGFQLTPYMNPDSESGLTTYSWGKADAYRMVEYPDGTGRGDIIFDMKQYKLAKSIGAFTEVQEVRQVQRLIIQNLKPVSKSAKKKLKTQPKSHSRAQWPELAYKDGETAEEKWPENGWPEPPTS